MNKRRHNQFETIHPFQDGNGRVGRLLLINVLIKNGLPPLNIELENRKEYYEALREYQINGNLRGKRPLSPCRGHLRPSIRVLGLASRGWLSV